MKSPIFFFFISFLLSYVLIGQNSTNEDFRNKSEKFSDSALFYFKKNDLKKSTELFFKAKELAEKTDDYALIARMNGNIAHQFVQLNLYDKALHYLNDAIKQINKLQESDQKKLLKTYSYLEIGNINFDEEKYLNANLSYKKALLEVEKIMTPNENIVYQHKRSLYNIGKTFYYLKKDSAEFYLNRALKIKNNHISGLDDFINQTLAELDYDRKEYNRAIKTLENILKNANKLDERLLSDVYYNLSKNYKSIGNQAKFSFYNEEFIQLNKSIKENEIKAISTAISAEQKSYSETITNANQSRTNIVMIASFFVILLLLIIIYLYYRRRKDHEIFDKIILDLKEKKANKSEKKFIKEATSQIPNSVEKEILDNLKKFEDSEKYINPKLSVANLALQLKTNTTYLSEIINTHKGKNFNAYINELRIAYICKKIYSNKDYQNYKISYLAEECGFTSHSTFATVFRNVTGISPSVFIREASKNKNT